MDGVFVLEYLSVEVFEALFVFFLWCRMDQQKVGSFSRQVIARFS